MSGTLEIPSALSSDLGLRLSEFSDQVLEEMQNSDDIAYVNHLRGQWDSLLAAVGRQSRKGVGRASAVLRLSEVRLGVLIGDQRRCDLDVDISAADCAYYKHCARFSGIVDEVIKDSTNLKPATRNAVTEAIRAHRYAIGDLSATRPRTRTVLSRPEVSEYRRLAKREMAMRLSRTGDPCGEAYASIRRAQAALLNAPTSKPRSDLEDVLVDAEDSAMKLLQHERAINLDQGGTDT